ncbi:MAG: T9SS type A sorting domain-containing protein [Bacteroidetes bacterium]|nr:T9SS type A sorting domain-containing protein [Bacteroidota bacterium]
MIKSFSVFLVFIVATLFFHSGVSAQVTFQKRTISSNTHGAGSVYSCDIDADGDLDVLAAGLVDNQIILFENNGDQIPGWTKRIVAYNVGSAHSVYAQDYDGDGDLDILGAAYVGNPGVAYWENDGGSPITWTRHTIGNSFINAHEVYSCDIDNDGDFDVLAASSDLNKIALWYNGGGSNPTWTEQTIVTNYTLAKSVRAGDMDGDGDMDIIGASIIDNEVTWWRNDGGSPITWTKQLIMANFFGAHRVEAVDIDGDGDQDVIGAAYLGNQIAWWRNDGGDPVTWQRQTLQYSFTTACIAHAADLDKDGDMDIIGTSQGRGEICAWINEGGDPITWTKVFIDDDFYRVWPLHSGDVDGDGDIDLIAGSSHNGNNEIRWYENTTVVEIEEENDIPTGYLLEQNYPNPFNPSTNISFSVPNTTDITLKIYSIFGEEVSTLASGTYAAGKYSIEFNGENLASSIYFYTLSADNFISTKKMTLLK